MKVKEYRSTSVILPDDGGEVTINLIRIPTKEDVLLCKMCAFATIGKETEDYPTNEWLHSIMEARHSPIRELHFAIEFVNLPSYIATHFARHIHARPYIQTQRNDRQKNYDRRKAPQDAAVRMIFCFEGEELQIIMNKRLCFLADPATRCVAQAISELVERCVPYCEGLLIPMCEYHGGVCHEMKPCGRCPV
jgi:hypothetical protein